MHLTRNQAYLYGYRGFESLPLRHRVIKINNLSYASQPDSHFRPNFWIFARKGCRREFSTLFSFSIIPRNSLNSNSRGPFRLMIRNKEAKSFDAALRDEIASGARIRRSFSSSWKRREGGTSLRIR